jgi:hypothetical protein
LRLLRGRVERAADAARVGLGDDAEVVDTLRRRPRPFRRPPGERRVVGAEHELFAAAHDLFELVAKAECVLIHRSANYRRRDGARSAGGTPAFRNAAVRGG